MTQSTQMGSKTVAELATRLKISIPEALTILKKAGFEQATEELQIPEGVLEQIVSYQLKARELAAYIDLLDLPTPTRPFEEVYEPFSHRIIRQEGVEGVMSGRDDRGRSCIYLYLGDDPEQPEIRELIDTLPAHVDGYALLVMYMGKIVACGEKKTGSADGVPSKTE